MERRGEDTRVLFVKANSLAPNSRIEKEMAALLDAGHEVYGLGWDRSRTRRMYEAKPLSIAGTPVRRWLIGIEANYGAGMRNIGPMLKYELKLAQALKSFPEEYDCIHACDFDSGYVASRFAQRVGKVLVYDIFDYYVDSHELPRCISRAVERAEIGVIDKADATIICTEQRREQISKANPKKLVVVENTPPDLFSEFITARGTDDPSVLKITYAGTLAHHRYIPELLEAVVEHDDLRLDIAGLGTLEPLVREKASQCDRIWYHGQISYREVLALESRADVLTAMYDPSIRNHIYAAPNKFYESLMLGKPLIAIEGTSVGTWVGVHGSGIALESDFTSDDFYQALWQLKSENENGPITERNRRTYVEKYDWSVMARRLSSLYLELEK